MTLTSHEKIYNLVSVLKPMIKELKDKNILTTDLADSILDELERLRRFE